MGKLVKLKFDTPEYRIACQQLGYLEQISQKGLLTLEQVKMYDLLVKNLSLAKKDAESEVEPAQPQQLTFSREEAEVFLKLAMEGDPLPKIQAKALSTASQSVPNIVSKEGIPYWLLQAQLDEDLRNEKSKVIEESDDNQES